METFQTDKMLTGTIVAIYTIAAVLIRPIVGYLVVIFDRKRLYVISLLFFVICFAGYPIAGSLVLIIVLRFLHGLSFGSLTVSANTLVIDISPASRRGEALGIYGVANTLGMVFGPMTAVFINKLYGYDMVFYTALTTGLISFVIGSLIIKAPKMEEVISKKISWDRFVLFIGLPAGSVLFLIGIPFGMLTTYVTLYSLELGLGKDTDFFYLLMAIGIIISRFYSGTQTDKGKLSAIIIIGISVASVSLFLIYASKFAAYIDPSLTRLIFNTSAFLIGFGYGCVFPAMNTLFMNMVPQSKRGTANSTYMTTWETGIGLGLLFTPLIGDSINYSLAFLIGAICAFIAICIFVFYVRNHYERHRIT